MSRVSKYTKELLEPAVASCNTWAGVCRSLGVSVAGSVQWHLRKLAAKYQLDTGHFTGQSWSRGRSVGPRRDLVDYLSNKHPISSHTLKTRLIQEGIKEAKCERCGLAEWLGEPIPLELDHINSNHYDNTFANLQIICPNCHTYLTNRRRFEASKKHCRCGGTKASKAKTCMACTVPTKRQARPQLEQINWPDDQALLSMVNTTSFSAVGRRLGVSDNAIRKRLKRRNLL